MKKLLRLLILIAICGFTACEQVNPPANTVAGTDVQVIGGNPVAGDEEEGNDEEQDDDDD